MRLETFAQHKAQKINLGPVWGELRPTIQGRSWTHSVSSCITDRLPNKVNPLGLSSYIMFSSAQIALFLCLLSKNDDKLEHIVAVQTQNQLLHAGWISVHFCAFLTHILVIRVCAGFQESPTGGVTSSVTHFLSDIAVEERSLPAKSTW